MVKTPNKSDAIQNDLDKLHRTWNNVTRSAEENEDKVKTAVKELTAWQVSRGDARVVISCGLLVYENFTKVFVMSGKSQSII